MRPIWLLLLSSAAFAQPHTCTVDKPCSMRLKGNGPAFSTNAPFDSPGVPDTRPGTWGNAAAYYLPIPFVDVPAGFRVRITRVYGDVIGWPHGQIVPGTFSGILSGLTTTTAPQSPFVGPGLGSAGCFLYLQGQLGTEGTRLAIDIPNITNGLLNADNILMMVEAIFLNETGVSIHMETTLVVEFVYEAPR